MTRLACAALLAAALLAPGCSGDDERLPVDAAGTADRAPTPDAAPVPDVTTSPDAEVPDAEPADASAADAEADAT